MLQLYDISFTTRVLVKKYDKRGKLVSEVPLDKPVSLSALPLSTASAYAGCDNFKMAPSTATHRGGYVRESGSKGWGAPATKRAAKHDRVSAQQTVAVKSTGNSSAAATGDLAAAINKG